MNTREALAELARQELITVYSSRTFEFRQPTLVELDQERYDELASRRAKRKIADRVRHAANAERRRQA